ncbi:MAG TPA: hypothetical protein VLK82_07440 [Candidatus Tectomicrobia bacterium]|nr:hypothetical protein [Candidatus Tectomicrobia bacterium]
MTTIHQMTFSAQHTVAFDAALRDARMQLPRSADAARADRGLVLALNGHVRLVSTTEAHVTSEKDPEVVYHVHSRGGCDCYDACRRLEQMPDAAPGVRACKHWYAAVLMAMAHVNVSLKGYVPAVAEVWYPAVSLDEQWYGHSGYATETEPGLWWFCFADWNGGFYTDTTMLEMYEKTPRHVTDWHGQVTRWERWLQG